jgi:exodeoxyribonuclease III
MKIVTWNINSIRARIQLLRRLCEEVNPDVVCLQETKVIDDLFPIEAFEELGFPHHVICGMKSYNGVAILSRLPLSDGDQRDWCGRSDCRHVHATLPDGTVLHNFYIPAGGDIPDPAKNDKFAHKLQFLAELTAWGKKLAKSKSQQIMVGDLNIAPLESDVWSHKQLLKEVSHTPVEVDALLAVMASGKWVDAVRQFFPQEEKLYSWWSYRARDWAAADRGRRLDHIWVTPGLVDRLQDAEVIRDARGWEKASDHAPVVVTLSD